MGKAPGRVGPHADDRMGESIYGQDLGRVQFSGVCVSWDAVRLTIVISALPRMRKSSLPALE